MARASGSYPEGHWFKSNYRYHFFSPGPLVKRSRHRPFTAVTGVRFPHGSPNGSLAQLGEHLPYKQRVTGSSPVTSTCISFWCRNAGVAELADAQDLKSCCSDTVPVRFRSPAFIERALDKSVIIDVKKLIEYVCVAQLDRALGYGPRCREFESSRARIGERS